MKNNIGQQHKSVRAAAAIVIDKVLRCSQTGSQSTTPTNSNKRSLLSINEHCEQGSNKAASQNAKSISDKKTLDTILTNTLNNVPKRDQALLQELCYGCLRWYHQHNYLLNKLLSKPLKHQDNIVLALLLLGIYQLQHTRIPHYAAIAATVDAARELNVNWAVKLINAVLRNFLRQRQTLTQSLTKNSSVSSVYSHPLWLINALQKAWPQHWQEILTANNQHPPLHLRVNLQVTTRADYLQLLTQHNIVAKATPFTTGGILLSQPCPVTKLPNFAEGWVSVQDSAAQLAAELLELKPKMNVLDACAAPGGKLTHILETENNLASVVGVEIDKIRLTKIQENLQRLFRSQTNFQSTSQQDTPCRDMPPMEPLFHINKHGEQEHNFSPRQNATMQLTLINNDASKPQLWWQQPHKKFQRILLDAPCSATGVIRRHPDIKILRQPNDIAKFAAKQLDILNALWPLLDINGILLYCTCSILPEENWLTIERFLSQHQDAHHETINAKWGIAVKFGRQILPGMDNMDGLYYAKISKKK